MDIPCLVAIFIFVFDSHKARVSQCKALRVCGTCPRCGHVAGVYFGREIELSFACGVCESKSHIGNYVLTLGLKLNLLSLYTQVLKIDAFCYL